ncbi:uncharacterized protein A4U43_C08F30340 [Asparagus officinalis]|nr:uncharacterized protein A4U43_C08F30340 [Asparagus officinalis]
MIILFYIDFTVVYVSGLSGFAYDLPALTLSSSCFDSSRVIWIFNIFWIWMPNMVNGISPGSSAVDSDRCSMVLIYQTEDPFLSSLEICTMARNRFLFNLEASVRRVAVDSIWYIPLVSLTSPVVLIIHISQMVKNSLVILRDFKLLKEQFISSDPMDLTCNSYGATLVLALLRMDYNLGVPSSKSRDFTALQSDLALGTMVKNNLLAFSVSKNSENDMERPWVRHCKRLVYGEGYLVHHLGVYVSESPETLA